MIEYLLDANVVVHWVTGVHRPLMFRLQERLHRCAASSIVWHELYSGAFKSDRPERNISGFEAVDLPILPFETNDAREAGQVRDALRRAGTPIGPYDILIAGQALARDLVLVTNNTRKFARVEGLRLEDWTVA